MPKRPWTMPVWMHQYKHLIPCGSERVEELVNDDGTNSNVFNNAPRALMCVAVKTAVDVLESLHEERLI